MSSRHPQKPNRQPSHQPPQSRQWATRSRRDSVWKVAMVATRVASRRPVAMRRSAAPDVGRRSRTAPMLPMAVWEWRRQLHRLASMQSPAIGRPTLLARQFRQPPSVRMGFAVGAAVTTALARTLLLGVRWHRQSRRRRLCLAPPRGVHTGDMLMMRCSCVKFRAG